MLTAPCYHLVTDGDPPAHVRHLFECPRKPEFERDLDCLLKGRIPIALKDLEDHLVSGKRLPGRALFISFDDGMREMEEIVAPLCWSKGVPVTFFLATAFLDNRTLFFRHKASILLDELQRRDGTEANIAEAELRRILALRGLDAADARQFLRSARYADNPHLDACAAALGVDFAAYLRDHRPYLTEDQVSALLRRNFSIGGHSIDHPLFSELDVTAQVEQTRACMEHLAERFGSRFKAFAFPFVSDGVTTEYYDRVFQERIADLAFCIGHVPVGYGARIIERFGVEGPSNHSATRALRMRTQPRMQRMLSRAKRVLQANAAK